MTYDKLPLTLKFRPYGPRYGYDPVCAHSLYCPPSLLGFCCFSASSCSPSGDHRLSWSLCFSILFWAPCASSYGFFFLDGFWDLKKNYCSQHVNSREGFKKKRFWRNEQMWDYEDVRSRVHLAHSSKNYCTIRIFLSKWRASYFRGVYTEWVSSLHVCLRSASHFWTMFLELCLWMYHFVLIFFCFFTVPTIL